MPSCGSSDALRAWAAWVVSRLSRHGQPAGGQSALRLAVVADYSKVMPEPERIVPCPNCRKPARWSVANRYRPFCSERCRLIDFGEWAEERYRIPGEELPRQSLEDPEHD